MKTRKTFLMVVVMALLFGGCQSLDRMMDSGDYDDVIARADKKLRGKKKKREKYVLALEEAFEKARKRDMNNINILKQKGSSEDFEKIISIASRIERRQEVLRPYLPLIAKEGYKAEFTFVKSEEILGYAQAQVQEELYREGQALLRQARSGDKLAARDAYAAFDRIFEYASVYSDAHLLRDEAYELGVNKVRIVQLNRSNAWMPDYVQNMLLSDFPVPDAFWTKFYFADDAPDDVDIEARFELTDLEVTPDIWREERRDRSRRIQDGWDYIYDSRGNVAKDSLGNDIRSERYVTVRADLFRTIQEKEARVQAQLQIVDLQTSRTIDSRPLYAVARFNHTAQSYAGDQRALNSRERRVVRPVAYPSDDALLLEAVERLKPMFVEELKRSYYAS